MEAYHCRVSLHRPGSLLLACWLTTAGLLCRAQSTGMRRDAESPAGVAAARFMPNAPEAHAAGGVVGGVICGTVLDANGAEVAGATVVLDGGNGKDQRGATTDDNGFFRFSSV